MSTLLESDIETVCKRSPAVTPYPDTVSSNGTFPCVTYKRLPLNLKNLTHSGRTAGTARFLFSVWGATKESSLDTAELIKTKFDLNNTDFKLSVLKDSYGTKEAESGRYQTVLMFHITSDKA